MSIPIITEIKRHKIRALKTLFTCLCYICIGLQSSIIGVALLDLRVLVGCSFNQISFVVTARSIGYACGSVFAGFIDNRINTQLMLMLLLFINSATQVVIPLCRVLYLMIIDCVIAGTTSGMIDCFANIFILKLWAKECPPFLQALHFSFGIGSFAIAFMTEPFLKEDKDSVDTIDWFISANDSSSAVNLTKVDLRSEDIDLIVPYSIIATFTAAVGVMFLFTFISYRDTTDHPSRNVNPVIEQSKDGKKVEVIRRVNPSMRYFVIVLVSLFLLFYVGLEETAGTFIPAYGHKGLLQLAKKTGALISAVYWMTYTGFRLCAVFFSSHISSLTFLMFNFVVTTMACIVLFLIQTSELAYWASCAMLGVGLSSTYGSIFGYMETQFPLNGKVVACFTVGGAIGSSAIPAIIGMLMANNNRIYAYSVVLFSILITVIFAIIYAICKTSLYTETKRVLKPQISVISEAKF